MAMAKVPRCAWCSSVSENIGLVLLVAKRMRLERKLGFSDKWKENDNGENSVWLAHICMLCYENLGRPFHVPNPQYLLGEVKEKEDELSDKLRSDLAMLRLAPPDKHVNGVGIRVRDLFEIVLLED